MNNKQIDRGLEELNKFYEHHTNPDIRRLYSSLYFVFEAMKEPEEKEEEKHTWGFIKAYCKKRDKPSEKKETLRHPMSYTREEVYRKGSKKDDSVIIEAYNSWKNIGAFTPLGEKLKSEDSWKAIKQYCEEEKK